MTKVKVLLPVPLESDYGAWTLDPSSSGAVFDTELYIGDVVKNVNDVIDIRFLGAPIHWEPMRNVPPGTGLRQYRDFREEVIATSGNFDSVNVGPNARPVVSVIQASGSTAPAIRAQSFGGDSPVVTARRDVGDDGGSGPVHHIIQNTEGDALLVDQHKPGTPIRVRNFAMTHGDFAFTPFPDGDPIQAEIGNMWFRAPGVGRRNSLAFKGLSGVVELRQCDGIVTRYLDPSGTTVNFTSTEAAAVWNAQTVQDPRFYSYSNDLTRIFVWVDAVYKISYTGAARLTNNNNRHTVQWGIRINNQPRVLPYSYCYGYHRNIADGIMSVSKTLFLRLNAGDNLRLVAQALTGTGTLQMIDGTSITIELVRGD